MKFFDKLFGGAKNAMRTPTEEEAFIAWVTDGVESPSLRKNENGGHILMSKTMMGRLTSRLRNNYFLQYTLRHTDSTTGEHMLHFTVAPGRFVNELPTVIAEKVWDEVEKTVFEDILACEGIKSIKQSKGYPQTNFDDVIYTIYALDEYDQPDSIILMHQDTERTLRLLKNVVGDYIWPINDDEDDLFGYQTDTVCHLPKGTILFTDYHSNVRVRIGSVYAKRESAGGEVVLKCSLPVTVEIERPEAIAVFNG